LLSNYSARANGKLLLTAEYLVLDGAAALALPCKYGQTMSVKKNMDVMTTVVCESMNTAGNIWFSGTFDMDNLAVLNTSDTPVAERFLSILKFIQKSNPAKFTSNTCLYFTHQIDFDRQWGLGTSSTLIYNMATWGGVNPYDLLAHTFGGSGYDIACAGASGPLLYRRQSPVPTFKSVTFDPPFADQLYFVYLGKKQNSREGIKNYRALQNESKKPHAIAEVEELNDNILAAKTLADFEESMCEHEDIISNIIEMPKVKDTCFSDLDGEAKSLGAWGGDFVLLTYEGGQESLKMYCQLKGFDLVISYEQMIL